MTYNVFSGTLNPTQSIIQSTSYVIDATMCRWVVSDGGGMGTVWLSMQSE